MKNKKHQKRNRILFVILFYVIAIGIVVALLPIYKDFSFVDKEMASKFWQYLPIYLLIPAAIVLYYVALFIYQLGQLILGLLTKYKLLSFNIFYLSFKKTDKLRVKFERYTSTIDCKLVPRKPYNEKYPYRLFLVGGTIFNAITIGVICAIILTKDVSFYMYYSLVIALFVNFMLMLFYLFPMNLMAPNNAMQLLMMRKNKTNHRAHYERLVANYELTCGKLYRDLQISTYEIKDYSNVLLIRLVLMKYYALLDQGNYAEAFPLISDLYQHVQDIPLGYVNTIQSEYFFHVAVIIKDIEISNKVLNSFNGNLKFILRSRRQLIEMYERVLLAKYLYIDKNSENAAREYRSAKNLISKITSAAEKNLSLALIDLMIKDLEVAIAEKKANDAMRYDIATVSAKFTRWQRFKFAFKKFFRKIGRFFAGLFGSKKHKAERPVDAKPVKKNQIPKKK